MNTSLTDPSLGPQAGADEACVTRARNDAVCATQSTVVPQSGETLAERLDSLVEMTRLVVPQIGKSVRGQIVRQAAKAYSVEQIDRLREHNRLAGASIDRWLQQAIHERPIDGAEIMEVVAVYFDHICRDVDAAVAMALREIHDLPLVDQMLKMSILGMTVAIEMGYDEKNVRLVGACGLVHDWGMIRVPKEIREARRSLTSAEWIEWKRHPIHVLEILQHVSGLPMVIPLVCYQVHEQPDGSGYPRRRTQQQIHDFARVLNVVDAYMASTSPRPQRAPLTPYAAMESLLRQSQQNAVDPQVVRALLDVLSLFPVGSLVTLSDGSTARVLRSNGGAYTRPIVQRLHDRAGNPVSPGANQEIVDLTKSDLKIEQPIPPPARHEAPPAAR